MLTASDRPATSATASGFATSRKAAIRKQPNGTAAALKSQVQSLETSLDEAQQRIKELEQRLKRRSRTQIDQPQRGEYDVSFSARASLDLGLELPPQHEVLSGVNKFLSTFNTILPLFDPQRLLSRVSTWYERPHQRDASTWAAINVVLSLAYRHIPDEEKPPIYSTLHFMNKAQSVLNDIMLGNSSLLDVQTIVGMVVLLQATSDLKPASALIPIALRLAHGLRLHSRANHDHLSAPETLERDRVFWIAYILDRDISMRTKLPPIQSQNDISIDWPSAIPTDGAGMLYTADNSSNFNFFLSRVQLAHIQGQVYEAMLSKSPTASDVYVRLDNVARIHQMLDDWLARIPSEFSASAITQSGNTNLQRAFGVLYSSHLTCRSVVCKAHAMEAQWIPSLQDFGRKVVEQGIVATPRLPVGWHTLVHESREYIELFVAIDHKDPAFIWMTACTYISAAVCLTANILFNPWHTKAEMDDQLINPAFSFLDDMILQAPLPQLKSLRRSWDELLKNSREMPFRNAVQNLDWLEATCS
ncbi:transcriptional activator Mut3p [Fusarium circinatum]|uniref:Transcriptional activator Mut3p n=1 Tax=Fusarium circinatum TaxID=48490 RepID=A0A8H5U9H3_FUSCI|nr:transcriptional activator Mut3p [Fusarium circinatum]